MEYQERIKQVTDKASKKAQAIVSATIKVESAKRWQHEHKGLTSEIITEICDKVSEIVK
jgi:hypothetical protein